MREPLALVLGEDDIRALVPHPAWDTNKYARGTVGVVGGSAAYPGAPVLAASAAARCGAGYVRLVTTSGATACAHAHLLSIPVSACDQGIWGTLCATSAIQAAQGLAKSDVILVGPGMGTSDDSERFLEALSQDRPMVFDADALTLIARNHGLLDMPARHPRILTPHEGEAARLLGRKIANRNEAPSLPRPGRATCLAAWSRPFSRRGSTRLTPRRSRCSSTAMRVGPLHAN